MKLGNLKLFGLLALMIIFVLALAGCDALQDTPELDQDAHGLRVTVNIPDDLVQGSGEVGVLKIEDHIEVEKIKVELIQNGSVFKTGVEIIEKELSEAGYEHEIQLTEIEAGEYKLKAQLIGTIREVEESRVLYEGYNEEVNIEPDTIVETSVLIKPFDAESLTVKLEEADCSEGVLENLKKLTLKHPEEDNHLITYEQTEKVIFDRKEGYQPSRWHLVFDFVSVRKDGIEVLLLPTQQREITLTIYEGEDGDIDIKVDVHKSPDAPTNVRIEEGNLKWDSNDADSYRVLRSEDSDPDPYKVDAFKVVADDLKGTEYPLFEEEEGYYWVRAFKDGYSSEAAGGVYKEPGGAFNNEFFETIQQAIKAAESGDTIIVGPGTYEEEGQIVINKNLTIQGKDKEKAIIKPTQDTGSSDDERGWFLVETGNEFNLRNVTLDGDGFKIHQAIRSLGSGSIENNIIKNIFYSQYIGIGMVVMGNDDMIIKDNYLENIERIGIMAFGEGIQNTLIKGNTFIGKGEGDHLDYGIEIGGGAKAEIKENEISNCWGIASTDGSASAGILVNDLYGKGTEAELEGNKLFNNFYGVIVGYDENDNSKADCIDNHFKNNKLHFLAQENTEVDFFDIQETNNFTPEETNIGKLLVPKPIHMEFIGESTKTISNENSSSFDFTVRTEYDGTLKYASDDLYSTPWIEVNYEKGDLKINSNEEVFEIDILWQPGTDQETSITDGKINIALDDLDGVFLQHFTDGKIDDGKLLYKRGKSGEGSMVDLKIEGALISEVLDENVQETIIFVTMHSAILDEGGDIDKENIGEDNITEKVDSVTFTLTIKGTE